MSSNTVRTAFRAAWPNVIGTFAIPLVNPLNNAASITATEFGVMTFSADSTRIVNTARDADETGSVVITIATPSGTGDARGAEIAEHVARRLLWLAPLNNEIDVVSVDGPTDEPQDDDSGLYYMTTIVVRYVRGFRVTA